MLLNLLVTALVSLTLYRLDEQKTSSNQLRVQRVHSDMLGLRSSAIVLEGAILAAETLLVNPNKLSGSARRKVDRRRRHLARCYYALKQEIFKLSLLVDPTSDFRP